MSYDQINIHCYNKSSVKTYKKSGVTHEIQIPEVDVVAVELDLSGDLFYMEEAVFGFAQRGTYNIDDRVCVVGFPLGSKDSTGLPVYKYSFISSEPQVSQLGQPFFFIDTNSRHGMSGSAVIYREKLQFTISEAGGKVKTKYKAAMVGVYAGRCSDDPDDVTSHLGRVWDYRLVEHIIRGTELPSDSNAGQDSKGEHTYRIRQENEEIDEGVLVFSEAENRLH